MRGILFDFDGLIIDTETAVYEGWRELYVEHGHELPLETYVQCVGSTTEVDYDPATELDRLVGRELDWDGLHLRKQKRIHQLLEAHDTLPGVRELIAEAIESGVPCALASSSPHEWIDPWLERLGLTESFTVVRCRGDVPNPKPAPDLFLSAAQGIGVAPDEVIVLEDSLNGLRAATAAGMRCAVVPNQITEVSDFSSAWKRLPSLEGVGLDSLRIV